MIRHYLKDECSGLECWCSNCSIDVQIINWYNLSSWVSYLSNLHPEGQSRLLTDTIDVNLTDNQLSIHDKLSLYYDLYGQCSLDDFYFVTSTLLGAMVNTLITIILLWQMLQFDWSMCRMFGITHWVYLWSGINRYNLDLALFPFVVYWILVIKKPRFPSQNGNHRNHNCVNQHYHYQPTY